MIKPIIINGESITPAMIRYDGTGVWIGNTHNPVDNPKLEFALLLAMFEDDDNMYGRGGSWVHERVKYDIRRVQMGFNNVIGGVGFGYVDSVQMPHLGGVVIEDGVTIHNNTCVDLGVTGDTFIGSGTRIDNLVHVAHNVRIGRNCYIVAGTVIGGSCVIGDDCFLGINSSIRNKVRIGNNCTVGMGAVITKDMPDGETWVGNPGRKIDK